MKFNLVTRTGHLLQTLGLDKLLLNSGSVFIRRAFGLALSFIWVLAITNLFGAETYGLVALGQIVMSFVGMLFCLGLDTAIIKLGATKRHFNQGTFQSDFVKKSLIIIVVSSLLGSLLLFLFRDWLAVTVFKNQQFTNYILLISYFSFLFILHKTTVGFLTVQNKFKRYGNYFYFLPNLLILIFVLIIYYLELPSFYIMAGYLCAFGILGVILLFQILQIPCNSTNTISFSSLLKLSTPMMMSSAFLFISNWTDTFMLGAMVSKEDLGIYNVTYKLATIALVVIAAVNTVLAPRIAELYDSNKIGQIYKEVQKATKVITYITVPIVLVLLLFRGPLLRLFGNEFDRGEITLIVIALGLLFNALSGSVGQVLNMTKHQNQLRNFTLVSAVFNVVLNYFLIQDLGILGAAIASLVSNIIFNGLSILYIKRKLGFYTFINLKELKI
ncbi:flippase [Psychroserpens sp. BH13MA-6]